jgi:hypothetical protein
MQSRRSSAWSARTIPTKRTGTAHVRKIFDDLSPALDILVQALGYPTIGEVLNKPSFRIVYEFARVRPRGLSHAGPGSSSAHALQGVRPDSRRTWEPSRPQGRAGLRRRASPRRRGGRGPSSRSQGPVPDGTHRAPTPEIPVLRRSDRARRRGPLVAATISEAPGRLDLEFKAQIVIVSSRSDARTVIGEDCR